MPITSSAHHWKCPSLEVLITGSAWKCLEVPITGPITSSALTGSAINCIILKFNLKHYLEYPSLEVPSSKLIFH